MEELEGVDIVLDLHDGGVKGQRVIDNLTECLGLHIFAEEGISDTVSDFLEGHLCHLVPERGGQLLDDLGHIQTAVFSESADNSVAQRRARSFMIGTVVEHLHKKTLPPPSL